MSKDDIDGMVLHFSGEPTIKWIPEDYGFTTPEHLDKAVWYYKNYELRCLKHDFWLCRKKWKYERGNQEMLLTWRLQILPEDKEWADMVFTKGLK